MSPSPPTGASSRSPGPRYLVLAFLARLPLAMGQFGTLLLVSSATGRYAAGGLAAGALAVGTALGAPVAGGLADRRGQRTVGAVQSLGAAGSGTASRDAAPPVARLGTLQSAVLVAVMGAVGVVFGGTQTGLTVLATEAGAPGLAGAVLPRR